MATPLLALRQTIAAAIESTVGTAETLNAAAGQFNAYDVTMTPTIPVQQRLAPGSFDKLTGVPGQRMGVCVFKIDLEWDGTATLPQWAEILLPACGYVKSGTTFYPKTEAPKAGSDVKTLTIATYVDETKKQIRGAMGTFRLVCPTGEKAYIEFTFSGVWDGKVDEALIEPTYPDDDISVMMNAPTTFDGEDLCTNETVFDAGNQVVPFECPSDPVGYEFFLITNRTNVVNADPASTTVADDDPFGDWEDGTEAVFNVTMDAAPGATIALNLPKAQIYGIGPANREDYEVDQIEFRGNKNGATKDQDAALIFTPA